MRSPAWTGVSPTWSSAIGRAEHLVERRHPPQDLLDRAVDQRRVFSESFPLVLVIAEHAQAATDRRASRLGATRDEQARLVHDRVVLHRAAAHRRVRPHRDERVVRLVAEPRHRVVEVRLELGDRGHHALHHLSTPVAHDRVETHHPLRPRLEVTPAVLREAEEVGGVATRELRGERVHNLHLASISDRVEQLVDECPQRLLLGDDAARREAPGDERALLGMPRVVLGDHVVLFRRPHRAVAATADEDGRPPLYVHEVGVPGDADHPGLRIVVHRVVGAQVGKRLVHAVEVGVEALVEEIRCGVHGHRACVAR